MMNTIEEEPSSKPEEEEKEIEKNLLEHIRDWDLVDSYKFFRNYMTENPIMQYVVKIKCIEFGKELLPTKLKDTKEQDRINVIYAKACKILKESQPKSRTINYSFEDFGGNKSIVELYELKASDAGTSKARKEEFDKVFKNFLEQQYESKMNNLQDVDDEIFHVLVVHDIIKTKIPTVDELIDNLIKDKINVGGSPCLTQEKATESTVQTKK